MLSEPSLIDAEGVKAFKTSTLPTWLRRRFGKVFEIADVDDASDFPFVIDFIQGPWLGNWGAGVVNEEEVLLVECCEPSVDLSKPAHIAKVLGCGFHIMEPSDAEATWVYFTAARSRSDAQRPAMIRACR